MVPPTHALTSQPPQHRATFRVGLSDPLPGSLYLRWHRDPVAAGDTAQTAGEHIQRVHGDRAAAFKSTSRHYCSGVEAAGIGDANVAPVLLKKIVPRVSVANERCPVDPIVDG